jgi:hypothetical protein
MQSAVVSLRLWFGSAGLKRHRPLAGAQRAARYDGDRKSLPALSRIEDEGGVELPGFSAGLSRGFVCSGSVIREGGR